MKLKAGFLFLFLFMFSVVIVSADYDIPSNYQKTEFNTTKWIQAYHEILVNTTSGIINLNKTTKYWDFNLFNEVDALNRLTHTSYKSYFNGLLRSDIAYLYTNWNFKDWTVSFNFYIDSVTLTDTQLYRMDIIAFTSALGSQAQLRALNEEMIGLFIQADTGLSDFNIAIHEETNGLNYISAFEEINLNTKYYVLMSKSGTTFNCKVYSDLSKTDKVFDKTITLHSDWNLAYINLPNSLGFPGDHETTGYVEYFTDSSGVYYGNGYLYSKNLLENTTEKIIMIGMNSTAQTATRITLYTSNDNFTWLLQIDNNGLGNMFQYKEILYDYSTLYVRVNITTVNNNLTPYLDELFYFHTYACAVSDETKPYVFIILFTIIGMLLGYAVDRT